MTLRPDNPMCTFVFPNKSPFRKKLYEKPLFMEFDAGMIVADDGEVLKNVWAWGTEKAKEIWRIK